MASDFDYTGIENHQAIFRESATGMQHSANVDDGSSVELLDGDQVVITSGGQRVIWSIASNAAWATLDPTEATALSLAQK